MGKPLLPILLLIVKVITQSLADLHIVSWLCRIVAIAGGKSDRHGVDAIESYCDGKRAGNKIHAFWEAWIERDSFKKV